MPIVHGDVLLREFPEIAHVGHVTALVAREYESGEEKVVVAVQSFCQSVAAMEPACEALAA